AVEPFDIGVSVAEGLLGVGPALLPESGPKFTVQQGFDGPEEFVVGPVPQAAVAVLGVLPGRSAGGAHDDRGAVVVGLEDLSADDPVRQRVEERQGPTDPTTDVEPPRRPVQPVTEPLRSRSDEPQAEVRVDLFLEVFGPSLQAAGTPGPVPVPGHDHVGLVVELRRLGLLAEAIDPDDETDVLDTTGFLGAHPLGEPLSLRLGADEEAFGALEQVVVEPQPC